MTCGELDKLICDFVAADLPGALMLAVQRHLDVCPNCADELSSYLRTIALARDAMNFEFDSDAPGDLVYSALRATEDL